MTAPRSPLALLALLVAMTVPAAASAQVSLRTQAPVNRGVATLVPGLAAQSVGLGFTIAELAARGEQSDGVAAGLVGVWMSESAAGLYAPFTVHGFSLAWGSSPSARTRGAAFGLLQGAWHASLVAGLQAISWGIADSRYTPCFECWDPRAFYLPTVASHAAVAGGMGIAAIATALVARVAERTAIHDGGAGGPRLAGYPLTLNRGAGLGFGGAW